MWLSDERALTSVIAATKWPEPIPLKEWLEIGNPLEDTGPAGERL